MERSQLAPRTFELILESIERHERLLGRDYPKSPQLPDFSNFSQDSFISEICHRHELFNKTAKEPRTNLNFFCNYVIISLSYFYFHIRTYSVLLNYFCLAPDLHASFLSDYICILIEK